jgi:hypothetical protein
VVTTTRTILKRRFEISGAELRQQLAELDEHRRRRDACGAHEFVRTSIEPPAWHCPHCRCTERADYVRGYSSGLVAAGADPRRFIADFGAWP